MRSSGSFPVRSISRRFVILSEAKDLLLRALIARSALFLFKLRHRSTGAVVVLILTAIAVAQSAPRSVTVPAAFDQGRIVIDVDLPLRNGTTERVRGWVDNGTPDLYMNQRVAALLGLNVGCDGPVCSAPSKSSGAPLEVAIGGMKVPLSPVTEIKVPRGKPAIGPGMSAEINIPSTILRNYDVLIDFPGREFTIGVPGILKFNGIKSKMLIDASTGLIQLPSKIDNKNYDLGLDLGSSASFLTEELFGRLSSAHANWPHLTGAVGPFNTGEQGDEPNWKLMRVDRIQYGPLFLTDVAVANLPTNLPNLRKTEAHVRIPGAGLLSSEALLNYRVGLDYAHSTVFFDIGRTVKLPDFDVVGLILRPEDDNRFTIVGVADFEGKPSVPEVQVGDQLIAVGDNPIAEFTLGQVWSLLEGAPGQERKLTVERAGKRFTVAAKVQHFLGEAPQNEDAKSKSKKK